MLATIETIARSTFLLFIRLLWGWQFLEAGFGKAKNIDKPLAYFASLGIPMHQVAAYGVTALEIVGGALLMLGLFPRPVAFLLSANMIGAYCFADFDALASLLSNPNAFISATPFSFLFVSLVVLLFGAGSVRADVLWKRLRGR